MDSPKPALDLEKELTCSICTELLYQPLTLLDCLHTFCGACLKEWFSWQAVAAENAQTPPAPDAPVFTCPSCRAPVRDTRHNATVATLLDMFLAASPDKARLEADKEEMNKKYKPGDRVMPKLNIAAKTPEQRRLDDEERRLIQEVREMSLREAVVGSGSSEASSRRRRGESTSRDGRAGRSRDPSRDPRDSDGRTRETRDRERRRQAAGEENRRRAEQTVLLHPETESRRRRSESRHRRDDSSDRRRRQIEHQSSLRSLISSSDVDSLDIEREIEEFARQIQEEGLLDGLDLDNIDLSSNDELSRKITEAYRRRQRERPRHEPTRRSNASAVPRQSEPALSEARPRLGESPRSASRQRTHSRTSSATSQTEERSRYPPSASSTHLEVHEPRRRRRTTSGSRDRSATVPVVPTQAEARPASRSATDLQLRSGSGGASTGRPVISEARSSSSPTVGSSAGRTAESPASASLPFSARAAGVLNIAQPHASALSLPSPSGVQGRRRPSDINTGAAAGAMITAQVSPLSPPLGSPGYQHPRQLYPEPSIACSRCGREHIEYELHYNCAVCKDGEWYLCLACYRLGKGCLYWFGFGEAGWAKWEKARKTSPSLDEPHRLWACRYLPPRRSPGGAEGRKTLTAEDPEARLQSGAFCARCLAWANECYWRCGACNDADWGFCNDCVNQGRCCSHPLLPLTYQPAQPAGMPPRDQSPPRSPGRPPSATVMTGPNALAIGSFRPLSFTTRCSLCRSAIPPTQDRYHCYWCAGPPGPDARPGDYDVCQRCYAGLVASGALSPENGPDGWRRCPQGHRMVVAGFQDAKGGQWRHVVRDLVGGRKLQIATVDDAALLKYCWHDLEGPAEGPGGGNGHGGGDGGEGGGPRPRRRERLVARDVSAATAIPLGGDAFPPDGGGGRRAAARWAWYPAAGADDELMFPRGAEVREVEDVNGEWFHGVYMGSKGLFPAPYVRVLEGGGGAS